MKNYIFGAGISALILKSFDKNDSFQIMGEKSGGQFSEKFQMGPRIVKCNEKVLSFFERFDIKKELKEFKVGYYYDNFIRDSFGDEQREKYFLRTRGKNKFDSSSMNSGLSELSGFEIYNYDVSKIFFHFRNSVYNFKIAKIDLKNRSFSTNEFSFRYDNIVSTIPLNVLCKLCSIDCNVKYDKIYFYKVKKMLMPITIDDKYNFVYFIDDRYKFHRATKIDRDHFCLESKFEIGKDELRFDDIIINDNCILVESDNKIKEVLNENNIYVFGRYGSAFHGVRIHDLINTAGEFYEQFMEYSERVQ